MLEALSVIGVLGGVGVAVAAALALADRRLPVQRDALVDAVDELLPQTQCAQCGYPGCRPYAEAVAEGAPLNLCPPGGVETQQALATLLDRAPGPPPTEPQAQLARIDEARCIGCFRCVEACPVDAIVGAPQLMHTVLEARCTGCELCLSPCPVDCIELVSVHHPTPPRPERILARPRNRQPDAAALPCIRCGACETVCPEDLEPQELHWYCSDGAWQAAADRGLSRCIECGLCNQVCPSNIDLLSEFTRGRQALAETQRARRAAADARERYQRHQRRKAARAEAWETRRRSRIDGGRERPWLD